MSQVLFTDPSHGVPSLPLISACSTPPVPSEDGPVVNTDPVNNPDCLLVADRIDIPVDDGLEMFYHERSDIPGICVASGGTSSWTPIKISRSRVRAADSDTSDDDVCLDDCLSLTYQRVDALPAIGGHGEILFRILPDIFRVTCTQECTASYGAKNDRGPESYLNRPSTSLSTTFAKSLP